jgi:hypothetical protein
MENEIVNPDEQLLRRKEVKLQRGDGYESVDDVRRALEALCRSTVLQSLTLFVVEIPVTSLHRLLRETKSLTSLDIFRCRFDSTHELRTCFPGSDTLEELTVCQVHEDFEFLLQGAAFLTGLRKFSIEPFFMPAETPLFGQVLGRFLEKSASDNLRRVQLSRFLCRPNMFGTIARALGNSHTVSEIALDHCRFDGTSTELFLQMLEKGTIETLVWCSWTDFAVPPDTLARRLLTSGLKRLCFGCARRGTDLLAALVQGLVEERCSVDTLNLLEVRYEDFSALTAQLPRLRLKELEVKNYMPDFNQHFEFLSAVRHNPSLQTIRLFDSWGFNVFTTTLTTIGERNRGLHRAVNKPQTLPLGWWHAWWKRIYRDALDCDMLEPIVFAYLRENVEHVVKGADSKKTNDS